VRQAPAEPPIVAGRGGQFFGRVQMHEGHLVLAERKQRQPELKP
jgi:hypothetical protein